jgi:K+-transporting ATPase ATPase A chain
MTAGLLQLALFLLVVGALVGPLGGYMARVFEGRPTVLDAALGPIERAVYRIAGVDPAREQTWTAYTAALLLFNFAGLVVLYVLQRLQHLLPLDPEGFGPVRPDVAFDTAVSFVTNTDWQAYAGERTLGYLVPMLGLTVQNFASAATGLAVAVALTRGFARHEAGTVGNFWVDVVRATFRVLLPLSLALAIVLAWQGVPQNLAPYVHATTLEGREQVLAQGPVASQEAIKELGTNGGGFFNANSAHPYENPTPLTNLLEVVAIFALGAALTHTFGVMVGDRRQGATLLGAMALLFLVGVIAVWAAEAHGNPAFARLGVAGGNMEGKEVRFGIAGSALFATVTTAASSGAVNAMHDSLTPLGGLVVLTNILLGEVIVGGVGAGLYGMLLFALLAVFIAGLMVGRTPEYLGKRIGSTEVTLAILAVLVAALGTLGLAATACVTRAGLAGPLARGPHGLTEILYAFASGTGNNGSAFGGLDAAAPFYTLTVAVAMLAGRFLVIVPVMGIAGVLAAGKRVPPSAGTLPTTGVLFVGLLVGTIVIVGGLTFFPALALGPISEQLAMAAGRSF